MVLCGLFDKMLGILPDVIINIIMLYKHDLELLEQIPDPYQIILEQIPNNINITTVDLLVYHIVELVTRLDLRAITLDELIDSPHQTIIDFELANQIYQQRLALYHKQDTFLLNPLWKVSIPYLIIEFLTTSDLFQLRQRILSNFNNTSFIFY